MLCLSPSHRVVFVYWAGMRDKSGRARKWQLWTSVQQERLISGNAFHLVRHASGHELSPRP